MTGFAARFGTPILGVLALALVLAAAFAPVALKVIDEAIYYAGALAMAGRGSLIVENGWDMFGAEALKLRFMNAGPHGLTPQYPPGAAILGAPLLSLFGMRGIVFLNALAAAATLFATRALGRAAFGREDVALAAALILALATYWTEYAFGVWPHALSTLFVTCSLWALMRGLAGDAGRVPGWAAVSGLAAGAGILVRVDTVLLLPVLAAAAILFAPRPWVTLGAGLAGLLPGLAAGAAINQFKFGTWNPISYGAEDGGVAIATHLPAIALSVLCLNALVLIRRFGWRPSRRTAWVVVTMAGAAALLVYAPLRDLAEAVARGAYRLGVDARLLPGPVIQDSDGVRLFWGLPKKALGQSLPWIGALPALLVLPLSRDAARAAAILLVAAVMWVLPFSVTAWYGGYGSNMRYFVPILPLLAVLGAWLWHALSQITGAGWSALLIGAAGGGALYAAWLFLQPSGIAGAQQILTLAVLAATAPVALLAGLRVRPGRLAAHVAQVLMAAGFACGAANLVIDLKIDRWSRNLIADAVDRLDGLPDRSLIYGRPELFPFQFAKPDGLLAIPATPDRRDLRLIEVALARGYRVFVAADQLDRLLTRSNRIVAFGPELGHPKSPFIEVLPLRHLPSPEPGGRTPAPAPQTDGQIP